MRLTKGCGTAGNSLHGSLDPWLVPGGFNALTRLSVANNNFRCLRMRSCVWMVHSCSWVTIDISNGDVCHL